MIKLVIKQKGYRKNSKGKQAMLYCGNRQIHTNIGLVAWYEASYNLKWLTA